MQQKMFSQTMSSIISFLEKEMSSQSSGERRELGENDLFV